MPAHSTRKTSGNGKGASSANALPSSIYGRRTPTPGERASFKRRLQLFSDLIHAPRLYAHLPAGQLNSLRIYAAAMLIASRPSIASVVAQMAKHAAAGQPFDFTPLDADRMAIDMLHAQRGDNRCDMGVAA